MPIPEKHNFQKINTDLEDRLMKPGMYRYLENGVVMASDSDKLGDVENAVGTVLLNNAGVSSGVAIGAHKDIESNTIIYMVSDNTIWRFDPSDESFTLILSWSGLNFSTDFLISGIDVINGNIVWTDNLNNIRKVHIAFAIAGDYPDPILEEDITLLRRGPRYALEVSKAEDIEVSQNNMDRDSFQFTYRYGKSVV